MSEPSFNNPDATVVARVSDITLPSGSVRKVPYTPLPGIIIFVHGVNSMGEWFDAAEEGLCDGLNVRLNRETFDDPSDDTIRGLLRTAQYSPELTPSGYLARTKSEEAIQPAQFVQDAERSPIIRFRWGYVANKEDLATVGPNILLDEDNAWGGGPFANGCTALPDLWSNGTVTDLFAGLQVEYMNTETSRLVYNCPARHYGAHAAWRLAAVVAQAREKHKAFYGKECPVTVVCHSQGNMVGLASAFIGDKRFDGKGVADTYILANPPYCVLPNWVDNLVQYDNVNDLGRITMLSRRKTLDRFFEIVKNRNDDLASDDCVNGYMSNTRSPWYRGEDQTAYPSHKRVFLYANPHDQVIAVSTVMGMGWMGLPQEVLAGRDKDMAGAKQPYVFKHAEGVLYQRIWAQGNPAKYSKDSPFKVGDVPGKSFVYYDESDPTKADGIQGGKGQFWLRKPLPLRFHLRRVWADERKSLLGKAGATIQGGIYEFAFVLIRLGSLGNASYPTVNATPPSGWKIHVNAHKVPNPIEPISIHLYHPQTDETGQQPKDDGQQRLDGKSGPPQGKVSGVFNQGPQSHTDELNPNTPTGDIYDKYRKKGQGGQGDEAALRYEHNASVRQLARRKKDNPYESAIELMDKESASKLEGEEYKDFREFDQDKREYFLKKAVNLNATNHSTILTNAAHSRQVMAYDVNVGLNVLPPDQMNWLRQFADWRYCDSKDPVMKDWREYYMNGRSARNVRLENHSNYKPNVPAEIGIDSERSNSGALSQKHRDLPPPPVMARERSPGQQLHEDWRAEQKQKLRLPTENDDAFGGTPGE